MLVFGWFSIVEIDGRVVQDTQDDQIREEDLENTAYHFVLNARTAGSMHEHDDSGTIKGVGRLVESVVFTKEKQAAMLQSLDDQGIEARLDLGCVAWWGGMKVDNAEVWDDVKSGKLKAWSIGGSGKRAAVDKQDPNSPCDEGDQQGFGKYSEDQPRDEHGRFGSGGGGVSTKPDWAPGVKPFSADPLRGKDINNAPEGHRSRIAAEAVKDLGKTMVAEMITKHEGFKQALEKSAWAEGRKERLIKMMETETKKIDKYQKLSDEQKQDPKNIKSFGRAQSELDRFGRRYEAAGQMLEESSKTVRDTISKTIEEGITGRIGGSIKLTLDPTLLASQRGYIKGYADHLKDFEKMIGGAPKGPDKGSREVRFNFKAGRPCYRNGTGTVFLSRPDRGTVFHEMGHWLEDNVPSVNAASHAFLENRTYGERLQSLNEIKGTTRHREDEVARPDKFLSAYTGRHYTDRIGLVSATEVTSMGFQHLSEDPAGFFKNDPDHFHYTLGVMRLAQGK